MQSVDCIVFFAAERFYFNFISSVSLTSHSIETCKAFANICNSASQTCRWFFSIREMIRGVISSIPINWILWASSSCVIGGFCSARPNLTLSEHIFPFIVNMLFWMIVRDQCGLCFDNGHVVRLRREELHWRGMADKMAQKWHRKCR